MTKNEGRRHIPPCIEPPDLAGRSVRFHPIVGGAAVLVVLAATTAAPWFQQHAPVIRLVFRDTAAVLLVLVARALISSVLRGATEARPVHRAAPADWFEKYRLSDPQPEPAMRKGTPGYRDPAPPADLDTEPRDGSRTEVTS